MSILSPGELRRLLAIPEPVVPVGSLCPGYVEPVKHPFAHGARAQPGIDF